MGGRDLAEILSFDAGMGAGECRVRVMHGIVARP